MYDLRINTKRWAVLAGSTLALSLAAARPATAQITSVMAGTDYFQTIPQTSDVFNIGPATYFVNFVGVPIGPGNTDTIVQRLNDVNVSGGSGMTPLRITALSLQSAAPINIGGSFFDLFVRLDPNPTGTQDTGLMTIHTTPGTNGGTWTSSLNVFFDLTAEPVGGGASMSLGTGELDFMEQSPQNWSSVAPEGALLVPGSYPDVNANIHTSNVPPGEVDFWPGAAPGAPGSGPAPWVMLDPEQAQLAMHGVKVTGAVECPEPSALAFLGSGVVGLFGIAWRRRKT